MEKAREFQKSIYFCFLIDTKSFDDMNHNKLWAILKELGIPDHCTCLLRNLYASQEATARTRYGTNDWFKVRGYDKAVYCHPAYLTSMQSTSCEMPGWMSDKLKSRLPGEISTTSDTQMVTLQRQKVKRN